MRSRTISRYKRAAASFGVAPVASNAESPREARQVCLVPNKRPKILATERDHFFQGMRFGGGHGSLRCWCVLIATSFPTDQGGGGLLLQPACHAFELRHDAPPKGPWRPNKITYSTSRSASASVTIGISIVVLM